jgi:hypothetical protein
LHDGGAAAHMSRVAAPAGREQQADGFRVVLVPEHAPL